MNGAELRRTSGGGSGHASRVAVMMGSDSDLPVMRECIDTLDEFDVAREVIVTSAHRSLERTISIARALKATGVRVIIAAAGGAAHLAGVVAAATTLPVIGVPCNRSALSGLDALYSTVQMPPGVPVACVGINAARNAALLAVEILACSDQELSAKLEQYREGLSAEVERKHERVVRALDEARGSETAGTQD